MALRYTAFAASALVVMTAFEHANGRALPGDEQQDLQRLVRSVLTGLSDPREFERRAGRAQERLDPAVVRSFAWLEIYYSLTGDAEAEPWLRHLRPMKLMWLGGDVTMRVRAADRARPDRTQSADRKVSDFGGCPRPMLRCTIAPLQQVFARPSGPLELGREGTMRPPTRAAAG